MVSKLATILCMVIISPQVLAVNETKPSIWKSEAELGYVSTSGNTDTETLNAKAKAVNEREKWKHTFGAEVIRTSDKGTVTAQRYLVSGKTDYKLSDIAYVFGLLEYEDDRFSGFNNQTSLVAGYGRNLIKNDVVHLAAELGAGARRNETNAGVTDIEGILYGAIDMDWKISKSANFNEKLTVESGSDATITKSVSGLKVKINSKLASKITYTIKHASKVPVGIDKTDKETAITLVYSF